MNPNTTLRRILDACHDHNAGDHDHPSDVRREDRRQARREARREAIAALDDLRRWLTNGGFLPNAVDTCDDFLAGR